MEGAWKKRRKSRRFEGVEIRRRLAEVMARSRLRAVNVGTQFNNVEINLENAPLGQSRLELPGDNDFLSFAQRILGRVEIKILGELHGDRAAAALELASLPVLFQCLLEFDHVHTLMTEERSVLADEYRFLQVL